MTFDIEVCYLLYHDRTPWISKNDIEVAKRRYRRSPANQVTIISVFFISIDYSIIIRIMSQLFTIIYDDLRSFLQKPKRLFYIIALSLKRR